MRASNRILLEQAARAIGRKLIGWGEGMHGVEMAHLRSETFGEIGGYNEWNPLEDDGDALRLVTKLRMHFEIVDGWSVCYAGTVMAEQFSERHGVDADAATRRAIVRAAASLAKDTTP